MTADLAQACADLAAWLPAAAELITQPDTQPLEGRTQPGSQPPWNTQVANVLTDIHAMVRELEQDIAYQVTGRYRIRGGSDVNTVKAIDAISSLAEALPEADASQVTRIISRHVTMICQLPAVDLEERARIIPAPCPRCDRAKLLFYERSRRVGCPACRRRGLMVEGTVSDGCVQWEDGEIT